MTVFLFSSIPTTAEAKLLNSKKNYAAAKKWCGNYIRTTGQDCKVESGRWKCPTGYRKAKKFGGFIKVAASKACIKGNVAKKHSPDYVLQCRGGGGMFARVRIKGDIEIYRIKKSRYAANSRKPAAGECAFIDRPLSASEPAQLRYKSKKPHLSHIDITSKQINPGWKGDPIVSVIKAIRNRKLFYVHVRNDRGWLDIRRVGP